MQPIGDTFGVESLSKRLETQRSQRSRRTAWNWNSRLPSARPRKFCSP